MSGLVLADIVRRGEAAFRQARRERRRATLCALLLGACLWLSARVSEVNPEVLIAGLPRVTEYFVRIMPDLRWATLLADSETEGSLASWFYRWDAWALLLLETANMAALATIGGAALALPLAFLAARNLARSAIPCQLARRGLEAMRTIPDIVYAPLFVCAFGVGALAGILAILIHTTGALGKLFSEVIENADMRPWDGLRASGATWWQACRFAILPQVLPNLLGCGLLRFEINVRGASVIGFVGAGGIGLQIAERIRVRHWDEVAFIIILMVTTVAVIDWISGRIRRRLIGSAEGRVR